MSLRAIRRLAESEAISWCLDSANKVERLLRYARNDKLFFGFGGTYRNVIANDPPAGGE